MISSHEFPVPGSSLRLFFRRSLLATVLVTGTGFFSSGCYVFRQVTEPIANILARYHCISIDLPPITLTPERTAAERQLLGENREIEKHGWLIASSQSSRRYERGAGGRSRPELELLRRLYREQSVLEFYDEYLREYRDRLGLLGEGYDGLVKLLPARYQRRAGRASPRARENAIRIASEVNRSRKWIYDYYRKQEARKKNPDFPSVRKKHLNKYRENVPRGIWIQDEQGAWSAKQ